MLGSIWNLFFGGAEYFRGFKKKSPMHRPSLVAAPRAPVRAPDAHYHQQLQQIKQMNSGMSANPVVNPHAGDPMGRGDPRMSQGARMNQSSEGGRLLPRGHPLGASIFGGGFDDVVPTRGLEPKSTTIPRPSNEVYQKSSAFEIE